MLGEKLVIRVWDTLTSQGLGGLLAPWQIKRIGTAKAEVRRQEMLAIAQADRDVADIRAGRKAVDEKGRLIPLPSPDSAKLTGLQIDPDFLLRHARREDFARSIERQLNLTKIAIKAEEEAESVPDQDVSDEPIDPDWITQWRLNAENVKNEDMQRLWARILSQEVKKPGKYSLRTLTVLAQVTNKEAEMITKVASYRIADFLINDAQEIFDRNGLLFRNLLTLEELGILNGVSSGTLKTAYKSATENEFIVVLPSNKIAVMIKRDDPNHTLEISRIIRITEIGQELMTLGSFETNSEYISFFASRMKQNGNRVLIGQVVGDSRATDFREH